MVQCKKCKLFVSTSKDDIVKCKGECEAIYHRKCVKNLKVFLKREICSECIQKEECNSPGKEREVSDLDKTPAEGVLAGINRKLEIIYKLEKRIEELHETVDFYAEQYQKMMEFSTETEKKLKSLEQKNIYLEKCNNALEERVMYLEQRDKETNLEIIGLQKLENENVKEVVSKVAQVLKVSTNDIEEARRVGKEKNKEGMPQAIMVKLRSKGARDQWMKARKLKPTNGDVYGNKNISRIYINEDLPRVKREIFWETRNQLKGLFDYIWVQNGNILVKKNEVDSKIHNVRSLSYLEVLKKNKNLTKTTV